ncbi:uncharacterized protein KY384_006742 [Bacidia gigantensis]|uniref:uncharacterized protein n=1 Tax=Bacidia gigantensis TaxID=2732470 RepID=UPI001D04F7F0|nr:uncharacterized protein KY384_006742 [Bacidia gigantensis]KAG8527826.1 hypothetical protein KY384_006742 [Bacidia gigantensis]
MARTFQTAEGACNKIMGRRENPYTGRQALQSPNIKLRYNRGALLSAPLASSHQPHRSPAERYPMLPKALDFRLGPTPTPLAPPAKRVPPYVPTQHKTARSTAPQGYQIYSVHHPNNHEHDNNGDDMSGAIAEPKSMKQRELKETKEEKTENEKSPVENARARAGRSFSKVSVDDWSVDSPEEENAGGEEAKRR